MSNDKKPDRKRKNPWVSGGSENSEQPQNPWNNSGGGQNRRPPELDDLLRKAQQNFQDALPGNMGTGTFIGLLLAVLILLWLASGLYIVNPGENGVIKRFGAWSTTQTVEGLSYHLPYPIETVTKINVTELRKMSVGFSEGAQSRSTVAGQKIDRPEESLMLTADRNIVELQMSLQWNIKSAEDYLFNIMDPENTIKKVAESAIREVVGQTDMFPIITTGRALIASKVKEIIQKNLDEYRSGVNIMQVLILKAEVHPEVQNAFQDVQSAKQDAEDTENRAQADREDILPKARGEAIKIIQEAQGYKQSQIAKATGDADRFKAIYSAYLGGKDVTKERIYIETMEEILKNAQKIIIDNNKNGPGVVPYLPLNDLNSKPTMQIPPQPTSQTLQ